MGRNENKVRKGLTEISSICSVDIIDVSNKILEYRDAIAATGETSNVKDSLVIKTKESIENIVQLLDSARDSLNSSSAHNALLAEAREKDRLEAIKLAEAKANDSKPETEFKDNSKNLLPPNKFRTNAFAEKY